MSRVAVATFLAPVPASLIFGRFFILAYIGILLFTVVLALPLFFLFVQKKRLSWWHAILAGKFMSQILPWGWPYGVVGIIHRNSVLTAGVGISTALLFWWIAVFRNREYPFVSSKLPVSQILFFPVFIFGFLFHGYLEENLEIHSGRVLSMQHVNPYPTPSKLCTVTVLLDNGKQVQSDFSGCNWPLEKLVATPCFHFHRRWSTLRFRVVYSVSNQCGHPPPVHNDPTIDRKITPREHAMRSPREAAEKALSEGNSSILREAVNYWSFEDPTEVLYWLEPNIDNNSSGKLRSMVLSIWMQHDPDPAFSRVELFLNSDSGKQYPMPLAWDYFDYRSKSDPDGANDWAMENGFSGLVKE